MIITVGRRWWETLPEAFFFLSFSHFYLFNIFLQTPHHCVVNFKQQKKAFLAWEMSIEQYLCVKITYTWSISTQPRVLDAYGREVCRDTKSSKIIKISSEGCKAQFFESQGLFSPLLSTTTLKVVLTLIKYFSKNVIWERMWGAVFSHCEFILLVFYFSHEYWSEWFLFLVLDLILSTPERGSSNLS